MRIRIDICYRGTAYHGWQKQPNSKTVQGVIEEKLGILLRESVETVGCGRTDTGVHARHFPLHFDMQGLLPENFMYRLNSILPDDIAALRCETANEEFHARFSAKSRTYRYYIHFTKDPFLNGLSWQKKAIPELTLLNTAAEMLVGENDYRCFTKGDEPAHHGFRCNVYKAGWEMNDAQLVFQVKANRFLRNMVRAMVGSLLNVGYNKQPLSDFSALLENGTRMDAGESVPAHGLFLESVEY